MLIVVCINCLLAVGVIKLTYGLWQWRPQLVDLNHDLQQAQVNPGLLTDPRQVGYRLTASRAQILAARLGMARWQKLTRQIDQVLQLVGIVRSLLLYRTRWTRRTRWTKRTGRTR
ncbi:MAG: hypothetical protein DCF15_06725 [Phormidesmis priestleyi]|uniref:Uncharacterized protein n=1 Tax=Phormidesmis priestleyi TaxID=268141 RepID=A0A2W4XKZ5_9CYAN|nr:MAG: hypothetical protein DCF15_06725 [Phormidesmis priestleyi]